ncbi:MAG: phosphate butyryltransferase [Halanaerobium sp.]|nr:phosphate butyryltransferase [Halanaerobium sp.]
MFQTFEEMVKQAEERPRARLSVAVAQDKEVLLAVKEALPLIEPVLVGDGARIKKIAEDIELDLSQVEVADYPDVSAAAEKAIQLVSKGRADFVMKGIVGTATVLRALLKDEYGLKKAKLLSHLSVFDLEALDRLIIMTDGAMNIAPDLNDKVEILQNAIPVAHAIGIEKPLVAPLAAVEVVNPKRPATMDAAALSKMADRGQIKGAIVDGPLAFDNAISEEAAKHKGIESPVAGRADILLVPDIEAGNILYKTITNFVKMRSASIVVGAKVPMVLTSRADDYLTKYYSIALGKMQLSR